MSTTLRNLKTVVVNAANRIVSTTVYPTADHSGAAVYASGNIATAGDAMQETHQAYGATANATPAELFLDNVSQRLTVAVQTAYALTAVVVARKSDGSAVAVWDVTAIVNRAAGNVAVTGGTVTARVTVPVGWDFGVSADTTNQSVKLLATGAAATAIDWCVSIRLVKVV